MKEQKYQSDLQTNAHSPEKPKNRDPATQVMAQHQKSVSQTEQTIYAHPLIRAVIQKHKNKTIRQEMQSIRPETVLYSKPRQKISEEMRFTSLPPSNSLYRSVCSAQIKHIKQQLQSNSTPRRSLPPKQSTKPSQTNNSKVSVSGLVTYNFSSVSAQRSLGFNITDHEAIMLQKMKKQAQAALCECKRKTNILAKTSLKRHRRTVKTEESILEDCGEEANHYLSRICRQKANNQELYGEKALNIKLMRGYMLTQNCSQEDAKYVIDAIKEINADESKRTRANKGNILDEDKVFAGRRMNINHRKVFVRHITFND